MEIGWGGGRLEGKKRGKGADDGEGFLGIEEGVRCLTSRYIYLDIGKQIKVPMAYMDVWIYVNVGINGSF